MICLRTAAILALLGIVSGNAAAVWESSTGSDERAYHCTDAAGISWSQPGLAFVVTSHSSRPVSPSFVVAGEGTPWTDHARLLIRGSQVSLHVHAEDGALLWAANPVGVSEYINELFRLQPGGEIRFVAGNVLLDVRGHLLVRFSSTPLVPAVLNPFDVWKMPAVGEFRRSGELDLVFASWDEWQAFDLSGNLLARRVVIDPYDRGDRAVSSSDASYFFVHTTNSRGDLLEFAARLQKFSLEPNLLELGEAYSFKKHWHVEFPSAHSMAALEYDLTGDGENELIVLHWPGGPAAHIVSSEGDMLYRFPRDDLFARGAIGDMNGDGQNELVLLGATKSQTASQWTPETALYGVQWTGEAFEVLYTLDVPDSRTDDWDYELASGVYPLALCDLTGDGRSEALVGSGQGSGGKSYLLDANGDKLWEYPHVLGAPTHYIIDDLTGDGHHEFIISTSMGQTLVFSPSVRMSPTDYTRPVEALLQAGHISQEEADAALEELEQLGLLSPPVSGETPFASSTVFGVIILLAVMLAGRRIRA